ncbi:6-pyruvoyl tetrahydropterin synthase family protein [Sulfuricurvum sp.]|uniref:6-pyruvoyl trahydropterin synthase family protein n=1 Tax=Sulfuricurvum sp. TaxID=2025608 RepID=UPI00286E396A|nr:6-pyruvoyl tetrahydropterin synthase family protein [Sulfuricurvum sp.]
MIIRKLFKFENAHVVRGCSTQRCRASIHGHSYKVEVLFESAYLDNGQMIYDFGLMKQGIKELIDSFDHAVAIWDGDETEYIEAMKSHSNRWAMLPVSPSCEQFSRIMFVMIDKLIWFTKMVNGEKMVRLSSIIVHETETGYAQCFREDAYSELMGLIKLEDIHFSDEVRQGWSDPQLWEKVLAGETFVNPMSV